MDDYRDFVREGIDSRGFVSDEVMYVLKKTNPIYCVDVVLVPKSKVPQVILFKRDSSAANPGEYWLVGGKQRLGEPIKKTAERKVLSEAGIEVKIIDDDQLFTCDIFHVKGFDERYVSVEEKDLPKDVCEIFHTPVTCYVATVDSLDTICDRLSAEDGNDGFRVFIKIDSNWDSYIKRAVRAAWEKRGFDNFE